MSTESTQKKLTREDPVEPEILGRLGELEQARNQIGAELLDIEQAKVRCLAAAHKVDEQRHRLFEKVLMDRGLPPNSVAEVDAQSGRLIIHREGGPPGFPVQPNGTAQAAPQPPAAAPAAAAPTS